MSGLAKATVQALKADRGAETEGPAVAVQFNPASLRIQLLNNVESGRTQTRQAEQHTGTSSSTLSLDLHFDTADEGTSDAPVNVRTRTAQVARFVLPQTGDDKQAPPRMRFHWGDLIFDGVMTSFSEDLDLFSSGGVPLRAKVSVSILNQDPRFESLASGPGAATGAGASRPGGAAFGLSIGGGVGLGISAGFGATLGGGAINLPQLSVGGGAADALAVRSGGAAFGPPRIGVALAGESPAGFAARNGIDPAAWRTLAAPGGLAPALPAGTEVAFPKGAATAPGVAAARGPAQPSAREMLDRVTAPDRPPSMREAVDTGFALAGAGGVDAAVQTVRQAQVDAASTAELRAFGLGSAGVTAAVPPTGGPARAPLQAGDLPRPRPLAPPAPPPPRADPRATTFGAGVPLLPRVGAPAAARPVLGRRAPAASLAPPPPAVRGDCGCGCGGRP